MAEIKSKLDRRKDRSEEINRKFTYLCEVVLADLKELALRIYTEDYLSVSQTVSEIDSNVTKCVEDALAGLGEPEIEFLKVNRGLNKSKGITFDIKKHIFEYIDTPSTVVTLKSK